MKTDLPHPFQDGPGGEESTRAATPEPDSRAGADPPEEPIHREDEIIAAIFRDMMEARDGGFEAAPVPLDRKSGERPLDQALLDTGQITIDQRDWLFRAYLARRVEQMRVKLLGKQVGSYYIVKEIASGGMGIVFKARQESPMFTREVALKFMLRGADASEEDRARFVEEVKGLAGLSHPNLVPIFDSGIIDDLYYFSMELIDGESLAAMARDGTVSMEGKIEAVRDVARALFYLHGNGVIHRDVKPANILIDRQGHAKLLDFGIAQFSGDARRRVIQAGTPHYMAPEIIEPGGRFGAIGPGADIYALGAVLYRLLFGREVFAGSGGVAEILDRTLCAPPGFPRARSERIAAPLERIIRRCLAKHAGERYHSAEDLVGDLDRFLRRRRSRIQRLALAASLLLATVLGALLIFSAQRREERPPVRESFDGYQKAIEEIGSVRPGSEAALQELLAGMRRAEPGSPGLDAARRRFASDAEGFWTELTRSAQGSANQAKDAVQGLEGPQALEEYRKGNQDLDEGSGARPGLESFRNLHSAMEHFQEARRLTAAQNSLKDLANQAKALALAESGKMRIFADDLRFSPEAAKLRQQAQEELKHGEESLEAKEFETARACFKKAAGNLQEAMELAKVIKDALAAEKDGKQAALRSLLERGRRMLAADGSAGLSINFPERFKSAGALLGECDRRLGAGDLPACRRGLEEFFRQLDGLEEETSGLESAARSARQEAGLLAAKRRQGFAGRGLPESLAQAAEAADRSWDEGERRLAARQFAAAEKSFQASGSACGEMLHRSGELLNGMAWVEAGSIRGIEVPGFYLDRCEATVGEFRRFLDFVRENGHRACGHPPDEVLVDHRPIGWEAQVKRDGSLPVVGVPLAVARAFASWRGKILPSPEQWELAARRGPDQKLRAFPYGQEFDPRKTRALVDEEAAAGGDGGGLFVPVDSMPEGGSHCGCLHMSGNAAEWVLQPASGEGSIMGGSSVTGHSAYLRCDRRFAPAQEDLRYVGFRCALKAFPGTPP